MDTEFEINAWLSLRVSLGAGDTISLTGSINDPFFADTNLSAHILGGRFGQKQHGKRLECISIFAHTCFRFQAQQASFTSNSSLIAIPFMILNWICALIPLQFQRDKQ